jgi:VanZ family protein
MLESPPAVLHRARWWAGFACVAALASVLSALAYLDRLPGVFRVEGVDKVFHFALAGALAFFLDGALGRRALPLPFHLTLARGAVPLAAVLVLLPAGIEEYLQRYAITRTSSGWDFAADVAGVAVLIPLSRRSAA